MKVLMISGDKNLLVPSTGAYERLQLQKKAVEQLDVVVWPRVYSTLEILRAARTKKYDVVTSQDPFWRGLFAWKLARITGARLNVQVHADLSVESFVRRVLARFVLRRADSIRVVSDKLKKQVEKIGTGAPVMVLPVFVDIEKFKKVARNTHQQKTILWIGRFEKEKNPEEALRVLASVQNEGIDAGLIMIGEGSLGQKLLESAHNLKGVSFEGWQDPRGYMARADVVVSTSIQESWGASIVEALAAGVPVVAPDVGIAREAGAFVVPREQLASKVAEVLKSNARGELKLSLSNAEEWAKQWKETLI